jgi:hypothetical protein
MKTPLVLALLAGLLGAYVLLVERHRLTDDATRAANQRLLPGLSHRQITAVRIERAGQAAFTIERSAAGGGEGAGVGGGAGESGGDGNGGGANESVSHGEDWRLAPGGDPAAPGVVAELLEVLDAQEIDRTTDAPVAVLGLEPPAVTVEIVAAGQRFGLRLGRADASGRGVFVARGGDARSLVVGRRLLELLDRDQAAFRDRRLLPRALAGSTIAMSWRAGNDAQQSLHARAGSWWDERGLLVSPAAVAAALRALQGLEAVGFPRSPAAPIERPPSQTLELTTQPPVAEAPAKGAATGGEERRSLRFWLGDSSCSEGGWLIERSGGGAGAGDGMTRRFCVSQAAVEGIWQALRSAHERQRRLFLVDAQQTAAVEIWEVGRPRLRLQRRDGDWRIVEPAVSYAADGEVIADWLGRLGEISVEGAPPAGGPTHARRLVVTGADGRERALVEVGRPAGAWVILRRGGETAPARAPAALYAALEPEPLRFRSRSVLSLSRYDVESVEITAPGADRLLARRGPGDGWQMSGRAAVAGAAAFDSAALESLLGAVTNLRATRFPASAPASFEPGRSIEVTVRAGQAVRRYRITLASGGSGPRLARLTGGEDRDPLIFEISPATWTELDGEAPRAPR